MSDDRINAAIEELKSFQPKPAGNDGDRLRNKTDNFIEEPILPSNIEQKIRVAKELIEEWEYAYFGWSEAADAQQAIVAKLEGARALSPAQKKNPGGRPRKWDSFWIEIVRIAIVDGELPSQDGMRERMREWVKTNFPDDDPDKSPSHESQIRACLSMLYATPGIVP
jgi:hypothetical protein